MKMIKDYIRSLEEKDPYQDIWQDGENPIITAANEEPPIHDADRKIIEQLVDRIDQLEERVKYLEDFGVLPDED